MRLNLAGRYRRVLILDPKGFWLGLLLRRRGYQQAGIARLWGKSSRVALARERIDSAEYARLTAGYEHMYNPDFHRLRLWEVAP